MTTAGETGTATARGWAAMRATVLVVLCGLLWWLVFPRLAWGAEWITYVLLRFPRLAGETGALSPSCCAAAVLAADQVTTAVRLGRAVAFILFQLPHTFLLLLPVVFGMGVVRSWCSPARARALLARRGAWVGSPLAALLGVLTPFCTCSAVPLFIGFVTAGVPLGTTLTFLIAAPLVNEVALVILLRLFGWSVALYYLGTGLALALLAGAVLGRLDRARYLAPWVAELETPPTPVPDERLRWDDRLARGATAVREIVGRVWHYVLLGVLAGALIHVGVEPHALVALLGAQHAWSVPLAVALGVPLYANPAGILPIVHALLDKGVDTGTVLAFMMAVTGLSLPEFIILRRVLRLRLILLFAALVTAGILLIGVLFNVVL